MEQLRTLTKRNGMIKVSVQKVLDEIQSPSEVALEVERLTGCFLAKVPD